MQNDNTLSISDLSANKNYISHMKLKLFAIFQIDVLVILFLAITIDSVCYVYSINFSRS